MLNAKTSRTPCASRKFKESFTKLNITLHSYAISTSAPA
jgi:hypothetical protein